MRKRFKYRSTKRVWKMILFFTMILWGSHYIPSVSLLETYSPLSTVIFRITTALLALMVFSLFNKTPFYSIRLTGWDWFWAIVASLTGGALSSLFFMMGVKYAGASLTAVLVNTSTFFIAILATLIGIERFSRRKLFGILVGLIGLMLVVFRDQSLSEILSSAEWQGMIFGLTAAFCISIYTLVGKIWFLPKLSGLNFTILSFLPSVVVLILGTLVFDPTLLVIHSGFDLFQILYFGIITTALVWVLFVESMNHLEATQSATFKLLIPPSASLFAFLFFGEALAWPFYLGMAFVLTGLYLVATSARRSSSNAGEAEKIMN